MDNKIKKIFFFLKTRPSLVVIGLLFCFQLKYIHFYQTYKANKIFDSDAKVYYSILPSLFYKNNLDSAHLKSLNLIPVNGTFTYKYSVGVALFEFPFYFYSSTLHGFNNPYSDWDAYWIQIGALFYSALAFLMLRRVLLIFVNELIALILIIILAIGTNLFYYTCVEPGMSHVYSFFSTSGLVLFTLLLREKFSGKYFFLFCFFASIGILIRPVNIILLSFPLLIYIEKNGFLTIFFI